MHHTSTALLGSTTRIVRSIRSSDRLRHCPDEVVLRGLSACSDIFLLLEPEVGIVREGQRPAIGGSSRVDDSRPISTKARPRGSEILRRADISIREVVATTEGHHIREDTHPCELDRGEVLILNLKSQERSLRAQGEATVSEGKRSIAIALIDVVTILQRHPLREVGYVKRSTFSIRIAAPLSRLSDPLEVPLTISAKEVDPLVRLSVRAILHRLEVIGVYGQLATTQRTSDDQRHAPGTLREVRATCSRDGCTRLLRMEVEAIAWHSRAIGISRATLHRNRGDRDRLSGLR